MYFFNILLFRIQNTDLAISWNRCVVRKVDFSCWWLFKVLIRKIQTFNSLLCNRITHCRNSVHIRPKNRVFIVSLDCLNTMHHWNMFLYQRLLWNRTWIQRMNVCMFVFRTWWKHSVMIATWSVLCSLLRSLLMSWRCCSLIRCSTLPWEIEKIFLVWILRHEWSFWISRWIKLVLLCCDHIVIVYSYWRSLVWWISNHLILFYSLHT